MVRRQFNPRPQFPIQTHKKNFPPQAAFIDFKFLFLCSTSFLYCDIYIYISDDVEFVYELSLLPNNTASETFLPKSLGLGSVDGVSVIETPSCR
jgi:hypothetical protein